jgi:hypothetical protein
MREERLEVSVTFDERHGYVASARAAARACRGKISLKLMDVAGTDGRGDIDVRLPVDDRLHALALDSKRIGAACNQAVFGRRPHRQFRNEI